MKQTMSIQTTPAVTRHSAHCADVRSYRTISGREAQLVQLIRGARPHERAAGPEGDFARLMLPAWRTELAQIRGMS